MKKQIFQNRRKLILMLSLIVILASSILTINGQSAPTAPTQTTNANQSVCDKLIDKDREACELAQMVNKLLAEKGALLDLANRRLDEINAQKELTKEQRVLAEDLRRVIADLKQVIESYKEFAEMLMKRPPKKCFISVFNC